MSPDAGQCATIYITGTRPDTFKNCVYRFSNLLIIADSFADAFGIQLWFLIAGISCTLMKVAGFFSSDVMGMENEPAQEAQHVSTELS